MRKMKRVLSLFLAGIMIFGLCACGKKDGEGSDKGKTEASAPVLTKQYVYHSQDLDLGIDFTRVGLYATTIADDRIFMVIEDWEHTLLPPDAEPEGDAEILPDTPVAQDVITKDVIASTDIAIDGDLIIEDDIFMPVDEVEYYGPAYVLVSVKTDGTDKKVHKLQMEDVETNSWISSWNILKDGSVVGISETWSEDWSDPENPISSSKYILMQWDTEGNLQWSSDISGNNGEYVYAQAVTQYKDNTVLVTGDYQVLTFDKEGNKLSQNMIEGADEITGSSVIIKENGKGLQVSYNNEYTKMYVSKFDLETCKMEEKVELPGTLTTYSLLAGQDTDFLLSNSTGLYTYNVGDAAPKKVMDYVNSDLLTFSLENVTFINDKEFIASYNDSVNWTNHVARFTYVDPATIPDKVTLMLGCNYLYADIRKAIIDFNKSNNQYRIAIKDYSSFSTPDDYMQSYTQMNNDIISGKMPDIMVIDSSQDITSWANKGLLVDIGEMLSKDEELSKLEYLDNVWEAFSINEKLYTVLSSFTVQTLMARKDLIGDREGWTMTEFNQFMATQADDVKPFGDDLLRDDLMYYIMQYCGSDFVDVNTGKCNFDSPEFISMLEFANTLPKEYPEGYWENMDWMAAETMYRDKKAVMMNGYILNINSLIYNIHGTLGAEPCFVGFPGLEGNSSVIMPGSNMFVISNKSAHIDGAWQFLRQYLTEEFQSGEELYELPVLKSAFEEKAKKATEKSFYIDPETGEKIEEEMYYWINDEQITLEPFTQKEVDDISNFIYSIKKRSYYNQDIINIVNEEAGSYFEGQKSAREVAQIIQSRVQIYVDENR